MPCPPLIQVTSAAPAVKMFGTHQIARKLEKKNTQLGNDSEKIKRKDILNTESEADK